MKTREEIIAGLDMALVGTRTGCWGGSAWSLQYPTEKILEALKYLLEKEKENGTK